MLWRGERFRTRSIPLSLQNPKKILVRDDGILTDLDYPHRDRSPSRPVFTEEEEKAFLATTDRERDSLVLERLGLTHRDIVPYPTLDASATDIRQLVDVDLFLADSRYAIESFVRIPTKAQTVVPFKFNLVQLHLHFNETGRDIILKARQHGVTTYYLAKILWKTMTRPATITFIIAHEKEAAEAAVSRMREMYSCFPKFLQQKLKHDKIGQLTFAGINSEIRVQVAKDASGRSFSCNILFGTEVGFWDIEEDKIHGLMQSVPVGSSGSVIIESTPNGVGNYFHRECLAARDPDGESDYKFFELPYYLNAEYDNDWIRTKKTQIKYETTDEGKRAWNQEYTCSFEQSQRNFFEKKFCEPKSPFRKRQAFDPLGKQYPRWATIFQDPVAKELYVIGADTAKGKAKGDFNSATVLSRKDHREVAHLYSRMHPRKFAAALAWVGRKYNFALLGVEAMDMGHTVLHILQNELMYPNLFYHIDDSKPGAETGPLGWQTNKKTRPVMLSELRDALVEGSLQLAFSPRQIEMEVFHIDDTGKATAPPGFYDDTVISAAIAHRLLSFPDMLREEDIALSIECLGG